ncbi:hypothetical protein L1987_37540 [Smallanthus sonchifolius]|uniref:Uncharacterized protein n=1 Tax=Smallanthus sonchifolius TaxID=185202 RepID=A0ACB9HGM2_9ASTR|nr:hypothetical protein L1987_37540 [Smallanthus sonchifolius]
MGFAFAAGTVDGRDAFNFKHGDNSVSKKLTKGPFFSTYSYLTKATAKVEALKDQRIRTINGSHNYEHDVAAKLHSFAQQMPRILCKMPGSGSVSAVQLRHFVHGSTLSIGNIIT